VKHPFEIPKGYRQLKYGNLIKKGDWVLDWAEDCVEKKQHYWHEVEKTTLIIKVKGGVLLWVGGVGTFVGSHEIVIRKAKE